MSDFPIVTSEQMATVDRIAVEDGLLIMQMMEYAGLNIARYVLSHKAESFLILCGKGNNGGDGLAAARHLINWGHDVKVLLAEDPSVMSEMARHHYDFLLKMGAPMEVWTGVDLHLEWFDSVDLIVDALLGYNISGDPRPPYDALINKSNEAEQPVVSIDLPSGLNGSTGTPYTPCIVAAATLTLALPKAGLTADAAKDYIGELSVADLGIPAFVYQKAELDVPAGLFQKSSVVSI
jgi:NAD(P)H-hydrate epimerase